MLKVNVTTFCGLSLAAADPHNVHPSTRPLRPSSPAVCLPVCGLEAIYDMCLLASLLASRMCVASFANELTRTKRNGNIVTVHNVTWSAAV